LPVFPSSRDTADTTNNFPRTTDNQSIEFEKLKKKVEAEVDRRDTTAVVKERVAAELEKEIWDQNQNWSFGRESWPTARSWIETHSN
jgi:hypothetical protein